LKIGVFTVLYNEWKLEKVLKYVSKLGYESVELAAWKGSNHIDIDKVLSGGATELKKTVEKYGLFISGLSNHLEGQLVLGPYDESTDDFFKGSPEEKMKYGIERMKKTAEAAAALDVPVVNGFIGSPNWGAWYIFPPGYEKVYEKGFETFAERWNPIFWQGIDPVVFIKKLGDRIYHAHAKDAELVKENLATSGVIPTGSWMRPGRGFRFRVVGWGDVNWKRVMTALLEVGYDYVLSYEHEDPVMSREDGCEKCIAFLKPLIIKAPLKQVWW